MVKHNFRAFAQEILPRQLLRLLLAAAILHIVLAITISLVGRTRILPQTFDERGIGISFAVDSNSYRYEAEVMAQLIQQGRFQDWWNHVSRYRAALHVRPYSIAFALLGKLLGYGVLAAEPVNLCYYLAILVMTYAIGAEVFDRRVGLYAATVVGMWPTLLLYTTQMLRDPLVIAATLLLILSLSLCISRSLSILQGCAVAAIGSAAMLLIWLCRADSWEIVYLILLLAAAGCALGQLTERRFGLGKTIATIAILLFAFWLPRGLPMFRLSELADQETWANPVNAKSEALPSTQMQSGGPISPWEKLSRQVGFLRHRFVVRYPQAGSNIDTEVDLRGSGDVIRYFPRAAAIGFFAPFPNMWLVRGTHVGLAGRLITGTEMLVMYFIIALMVITLIHHWRRSLVWFLFATSAAGCLALGYVVLNISSLYRMRYPFFVLVIILGVRGWFIAGEKYFGIRSRSGLEAEPRRRAPA